MLLLNIETRDDVNGDDCENKTFQRTMLYNAIWWLELKYVFFFSKGLTGVESDLFDDSWNRQAVNMTKMSSSKA